TADSLLVGTGAFAGTLKAGSSGDQVLTIKPKTAGTAINLGGADAAGTLGLTEDELDRVSAGTLVIGKANSGNISVSSAIAMTTASTPGGFTVPTLSLVSGGTITESGAGAIKAATLTTSSVGGTTLGGANAVGTFNATNTTSGNVTMIESAGNLTVGTV